MENPAPKTAADRPPAPAAHGRESPPAYPEQSPAASPRRRPAPPAPPGRSCWSCESAAVPASGSTRPAHRRSRTIATFGRPNTRRSPRPQAAASAISAPPIRVPMASTDSPCRASLPRGTTFSPTLKLRPASTRITSPLPQDMLDHHHRIRALRHRRPGHDCNRRSRPQRIAGPDLSRTGPHPLPSARSQCRSPPPALQIRPGWSGRTAADPGRLLPPLDSTRPTLRSNSTDSLSGCGASPASAATILSASSNSTTPGMQHAPRKTRGPGR